MNRKKLQVIVKAETRAWITRSGSVTKFQNIALASGPPAKPVVEAQAPGTRFEGRWITWLPQETVEADSEARATAASSEAVYPWTFTIGWPRQLKQKILRSASSWLPLSARNWGLKLPIPYDCKESCPSAASPRHKKARTRRAFR